MATCPASRSEPSAWGRSEKGLAARIAPRSVVSADEIRRRACTFRAHDCDSCSWPSRRRPRFLRTRSALKPVKVERYAAPASCDHRRFSDVQPPRPPRRGKGGKMPDKIANVVLVHGGFVDGSGWQGVYDLLTADGYRVSVVQNPTVSLEGDAAATR